MKKNIYHFLIFSLLLFVFGKSLAQKTAEVNQLPPGLCLAHVVLDAQTNVSCNGGSNGSATVHGYISGTTTNCANPGVNDLNDIDYSWNTNPVQNARTANGLSAGTYIVAWSDPDGDAAPKSFTVTITEPPALGASITQTAATCGNCNGTVDITFVSGGTGTYTYLWTPGNYTSSGVGNRCAGQNMSCTIKDANGCPLVKSTTVPGTNATNASIQSPHTDVKCYNGNTGSATATATGGGGAPYTYLWSGGGGNAAMANGLTAGAYSCTVTGSNGCTDVATVTISQPASGISGSATPGTPETCGNSQGSASCSASGGTGTLSYNWSFGMQAGPNLTGAPAGNYICTVKDANNCVNTFPVTISSYNPSLNGTLVSQKDVNCFGASTGSVTINGGGGQSPYTFNWSAWGLGTSSGSMSNLAAGSYNPIPITDANGCTGAVGVTIAGPSAPLTTNAVQTQQATCGSATGQADAQATGGSPPYNYVWTPYGSGATPSGLSAGPYSVTVTDNNGCTATSNVTITSSGGMTASAVQNGAVTCFGGNNGSATVNVNGGTPNYTYQWSPYGIGSSPNNLSAGNYSITVTDNAGCVAVTSVSISQPADITAAINTVPASCSSSNGSATATPGGGTGAYTYAWTPGGQATQTAANLTAGNYSVTVKDVNSCFKVFPVTVPGSAGPLISCTTASATCFGGNNGSATANPTLGGGPPYTYSWNTVPIQNTQTAVGLAAGTYSVTVSTAACTNGAVVTVGQAASISANINTTTTPCQQSIGSATATPAGGTGPYTYAWSPGGQTTQTAVNLAAGTYTVVIKDAHSCSQAFFAQVNNVGGPAINFTPVSGVTCFGGSNGSATANVTGGAAPFTYAWSPAGGTNATANNLSAGIYSAVVSDAGGCVSSGTVSINEPAQLVAGVVKSTVAICAGSSKVISANPSGGNGGYSFVWSSPQGLSCTSCQSPSAGPAANTNYTVTVTDSKGCTGKGTVSVLISLPVVNAGPNKTICLGNGTNIGNAPVNGMTYLWSPAAGLNSTTLANPVANPGANSTYVVTGTDSIGCTKKDTVTVAIAPGLNVTSAASTATICTGAGTTTLSAAGGTTYVWSPGGQTGASVTVSPENPTTFTVVGTSAAGCKGISTVFINVVQTNFLPPLVTPAISSYCAGDSIPVFTATPNPPGTQISWTDPLDSYYVTGTTYQPPTAAGSYTILCAQGNTSWCKSYATTIPFVIHPLPAADAGNSITVCPGFSTHLHATGGTKYLWSPSSTLSSTSSSNPMANPALNTTYQVIVTDANNCKNQDSVKVFVVLNDTCGISFYNIITPNGDDKNDVWIIDGVSFFPKNSVAIYNRWGAKVWDGENYDNDRVLWKGTDKKGAKLPDGTYYYVVELGDATFTGFVELLN